MKKNYYILLELSLDPPEKDLSKINEEIDKKQKHWSSLRNHPTKGREAQQNLGEIPKIRQVMNNPSLIQLEIDEAKKIIFEEQKEKFKEFDEIIKLLSSKGNITENELGDLIKKYSSIKESELRKRIKVPIVKDEIKRAKRKPLDGAVSRKISDSLKIIGKNSLYEFLGLLPSSSLKPLQESTDEKYNELSKKASKDAFNTASMELVGICKSVFKTDSERNSYDDTLLLDKFGILSQKIDTISSVSKMIDHNTYNHLLKDTMDFGFAKEEAQDCINEYCRKKGISVQVPSKLIVDEMKQCGCCGTMNKNESNVCGNCGYFLEIECPKCKKKNQSVSKVCVQCGFIVGDMPNALNFVREANISLTDGDVNKAYNLFKKADIYWPNNPEVLKKIQEIEFTRKNITDLVNELNFALSQKFFYKAKSLINKLKIIDHQNNELINEELINKKIYNAEEFVKKAKTSSNNDIAIEFYSEAINECKDCQDAIDGMAKSPPDSPLDIKVLPSSRGINITWTPSSSKGMVSYRLVRNITPPHSSNDGDVICETHQNNFDDIKTESGVVYYYSVYSIRGSISSLKGTVSKSVMRITDIDNLEVIPADSGIKISWKPSANSKEIIVIRKEGSIPVNESDGQKVPGVYLNGVTDSGLKNGILYGYLLISSFIDENGVTVKSRGVTFQSVPLEPPKPVTDLTVNKKGNTLEIYWSQPKKGNVQLFYSETPFSTTSGSTISASKLSEFGKSIIVRSLGKTQETITFQGTIYILPVTVDGDLAVLGEARSVTSIDDVSDLKSTINSGNFYLEWKWPLGSKKVVICYNNTSFPVKPDENSSISVILTKEQYEKNSAYVLRKLEEKDYFITVFVASDEGEKAIYSSGVNHLVDNSGFHEIFYEVSLKKNFFSRKIDSAKLLIKTSSKEVTLPELILVKKLGDIPIRKSDGYIIHTIPPGLILGNSSIFEIEIPPKELSKGSYTKLFTQDDRHTAKFRLISAAKDKLSLG